eukprot:3002238-Prymnesium_polylepis.1
MDQKVEAAETERKAAKDEAPDAVLLVNVDEAPKGCCSCDPAPGGCRAWLKDIVLAPWFGNISTAFVLFNVAVMCMPFAGMSEDYAAFVELLGSIISWVFIVEMVLKLIALGCGGYWSDTWNCLDGTIVLMSVFEMALTVLLAGGGANLSFLRILRMLRIVRMLRLMKSWKGLYKIIMAFAKSIPQVGNLFILMALITLIFALLGMQSFGASFDPVEEDMRAHFDYIGPSMITVFL